ncbi:MAG: hypothetical protein M9948_03655 [Lentimicrobium sp.]|nr:hypothetical protein [Lentimicrobium sp.]
MILEGALIKQLGILLISAVKFLVAAPVSYLFGYSYLHTLINTSIGGLLGVIVFFFLSRMLIRFYLRHFPLIFRAIEQVSGVRLGKNNITERPKARVFNRRNRLIIKIRNSYGYAGIIILTPVLLSIPIGTFLALKYYSKKRNLLPMLSLSVIFWSVVLTTFIELL